MRRVGWMLMPLILVAFSPPTVAVAEVLGHNDRAVVRLADPVLDNMFAGMANLDYQAFVRDFDATMKKQVDEQEFQKLVTYSAERYGAYQRRALLGFLNKQGTTTVLWKTRFSGTEDDVPLLAP